MTDQKKKKQDEYDEEIPVKKSMVFLEEDHEYDEDDEDEEYDEEYEENTVSDILCQTRDTMIEYVKLQGIPLCQDLSYSNLYDFARQL